MKMKRSKAPDPVLKAMLMRCSKENNQQIRGFMGGDKAVLLSPVEHRLFKKTKDFTAGKKVNLSRCFVWILFLCNLVATGVINLKQSRIQLNKKILNQPRFYKRKTFEVLLNTLPKTMARIKDRFLKISQDTKSYYQSI